MATSLSILVDNFTEGIQKIKSKDYNCFLKHERAKDNFTKYQCLFCNKIYSSKIDEILKKRFKNTSFLIVKSINFKLLRKGVYPYEHMDEWENFNETQFQRFCKGFDFEIKK